MGLLTGTNIVVDNFKDFKPRGGNSYIYFLSHMHAGRQFE